MFEIDTPEKVYVVTFDYDRALNETQCVISVLDANDNIKELEHYEGYSHCEPEDIFCKATGRKFALTHALSPKVLNKETHKYEVKHNLPKDIRKMIWDGYFLLSSVKKIRKTTPR